jgi:hypothetical protein
LILKANKKKKPRLAPGQGCNLNRRGKGTRVDGRKASPADRFGITTDALSEIEETVYNHLDNKALMMGDDSVWQELKLASPLRALLADNVAREAGFRLQPLLAAAGCEYAEMLTRTILDHQQGRRPIHWKAIADQAVAFCATLTCWEKSARWLHGPFKAAGLSLQKDVTPRTKPVFSAALGAWTLLGPHARPPLSNEPEVETLSEKLRRTIRHIGLLAPERKPIRKQRHNLTQAEIADVKRDNPGASIEKICTILDAKRWPLIDSWKNPNFKTWHAIWKSSEHRRKVKRYISGVPASREKRQQFVQ